MKEPSKLLDNKCITITGIHSGTVYKNSETNQARNEPNSHVLARARALPPHTCVFIYLFREGGGSEQIPYRNVKHGSPKCASYGGLS